MPLHVALRFAYDGSAFDAYQRQPGLRTVESALIAALQEEGLVEDGFRTGSRTDAGVSAMANVAAARLERAHVKGLVPALQRHLPGGLWATGAAVAPAGFDPRKASWRSYRYLAARRGESLPRMREAARHFVGTHGMQAFARIESHRDPVRTVHVFRIVPHASSWGFTVRGQSFLQGQVRRMVGAVLAVGSGAAEASDVLEGLRTGRKHPRFHAVPAQALVLERVAYPNLRWAPEAGRPPDGSWPAAYAQRLAVARHVAKMARR